MKQVDEQIQKLAFQLSKTVKFNLMWQSLSVVLKFL